MRSNGRLPDFIIIGAMKAGTTSLYQYLKKHPALSACQRKEPGYFAKVAWDRGLDWYKGLFPDNTKIKFEASTHYTKSDKFGPVPQRMHALIPDVKLIYIVRHPIDRLLSHIHHMMVKDDELAGHYANPDFWKTQGDHYIACSKYHAQVCRYLEYFDLKQICILRFEDFVADPLSTVNEVLRFIGVDEQMFPGDMNFRRHNTLSTHARVKFPLVYRYLAAAHRRRLVPPVHRLLEQQVARPQITREHQEYLWNIFSEDLSKLETLTGRRFGYQLHE